MAPEYNLHSRHPKKHLASDFRAQEQKPITNCFNSISELPFIQDPRKKARLWRFLFHLLLMSKPSYNALIVDDEPDAREMLHVLLQEFFPTIEVVDKASGVEEAMQALAKTNIDLVFLDVEMQDGSGFDFLSRLPVRSFQVIFITAFDQYAIKAIKAAAFDYLLKPVNEDEFKEAVNRVLGAKFHQLLKGATAPSQRPELRKIGIPNLNGFQMVEVDRIIRCEADNNYTRVFFEGGTQEVVSRTLSRFEKDLTPFGFLRIHHRHLVNLNLISHYSKGKGGGWITLCDQSVLEVSVRRKSDLIRAISPMPEGSI